MYLVIISVNGFLCLDMADSSLFVLLVNPHLTGYILMSNLGIQQSKVYQQMVLSCMSATCFAKMAVACFTICKNLVIIKEKKQHKCSFRV